MARTYGKFQHVPAESSPDRRSYWAVRAEPHVMTRIKRVFPRARQDSSRMLLLADTAEVARDLQWFMERFPLRPANAASLTRLEQRATAHRNSEETVLRILDGHHPNYGWRTPARPPRDYQQQAADLVHATGRLLLGDDLGLGKAQPLHAPVLTPAGFRDIGALRPGDPIIAPDATVTRVRAVYPQDDLDCYRVTFSDGASVECSDEHLWRVTDHATPDGPAWQTLTLRQILNAGLHTAHGPRWHVPLLSAPDLHGEQPRPIEPYAAGVLLGAATRQPAGGVILSCADPELADLTAARLPAGTALRHRDSHHYTVHTDPGEPTDSLRALLATAGAVPTAYLHAPSADRLALLQGLMDARGQVIGPHAAAQSVFGATSPAQAQHVRWLAESLGGTAQTARRGPGRYLVTVHLPRALHPFRLTRKASRWRAAGSAADPARAITAVHHVGRQPMRCIAVDHPARLYVTDHFVVTHNTFTSLLVLCNPAALPALVVTLTALPTQWLGELEQSLPWLRAHIVTSRAAYDPAARMPDGRPPDVLIMNYNKLSGWGDYLAGHIKTVIFDEAHELRRGEQAQKGIAAAIIAAQADFRMGLTATPIFNYGDEIHNVMSVLDRDALGTRAEFLREWCGRDTDTSDGKIKVRDPVALGTYLRDAGVMLRRTRPEVGRVLPPVMRIEQPVETDHDVLDRLSGNAVEMARQVLTSRDRDERFQAGGELNSRIRHATGVAKAPYVAEFVRLLLESEQRVLLVGWHRDTYDIWLDRLRPFYPVLYTGTESVAEKLRSVELFAKGAARVLMMSLRSGAGLDGLQKYCKVVVFGELDWSPAMHSQVIGRLNRDGQSDPVLAYFMVSDGGSDPPMAEVLDIKRQQADPIVDPHSQPVEPRDPAAERGRARALAIEVLRRHGLLTPDLLAAAPAADQRSEPAVLAGVARSATPGGNHGNR